MVTANIDDYDGTCWRLYRIHIHIRLLAGVSGYILASVAPPVAASAQSSEALSQLSRGLLVFRMCHVPTNLLLQWVLFSHRLLDQVAVCFTVGIIGNPYYGYNSFGLNWGVAYDLPNTTWVLQHLHGFATHPVAPAVLRRRSRSAIYRQIEAVVDK